MKDRESLYPQDWLRIADKDWKRANQLLKKHDPELAGFCLQQAIEKYLKAFLLSNKWKLRRIHDLDALLDDAIIYEKSLENYRSVCQKISGFYFVERYPLMLDSGLVEDDVRLAIEKVEGLVLWIRAKLTRKKR